MKQAHVFIGDNFYDVEVGTILNVTGLTAVENDCLLFQSKLSEKVYGLITKVDNGVFTVKIINIDFLKDIDNSNIEETVEEEVIEEDVIVEGNTTIDFDSMTKKELITYIKENNLPIETNKVNKATLLEELKKSLV